MSKKYLDENGLLYFWQKIKTLFALATHTHTKNQITDFPTIPSKTSDLTNDSNFVSDSAYVHTDNNYTSAEKNKLSGIAAGAEVNVQSDWDQTDTTADDYIKNKPTIPSAVTVDSALSSTSENPVQNKVINTALGSKANGNGRIFYGTCSTSATASVKTVACANYDGYRDGDILIVNFANVNSNSSPQLNVNNEGSKYIKQIYKGDIVTLRSSTYVGANTNIFIYDAYATSTPCWVLLNVDENTTYNNATTSVAGLMSTTDKGKVDKLIFDSNNLIDSSILPSYVDDVVEAYPRSGATELSSAWLSLTSGGSALTPETGKIYVLMADSTSYAANTQFRWSGSAYVKLADGGVSEITNAEIDTILAS